MFNATIATRSRAASTNSSNNGVIEPITTTSLDVSDDASTSADDINDSASGKISATTTTNINSSNMDLDTANMKSLADLDLDSFMDVTEVLHNFKVETNALIIKLVVATSAKNKDINMTILEAQNLTSDSDKEINADNNGDKRSTVPNNMPLFKWNTATNSDTGFNSLKECLMRFEDILNAHDLKFDTHWRRLIVYCLAVEQRAWLDDFVLDNANTAILYHDFKAAFIQNYEATTAEEQALASNILMTICMEPNESIEVFIERFIQLKRHAATVDPTILISRFINALPVELSNQVTFILTGASDTNKRSLIYVMSLAKDLYTKLFQFSNNLNMLNSSNNGSSSRQHLTGRQNNLYEGHCGDPPTVVINHTIKQY
ncbi:hypothetical protein INT47_003561 [Mucor saturninus]|uniref:Retrotransposon gag domain-containing protein n=1 Tax=Mucor saturninus TaxID=64648 RepID=A0A8H7QHL3_9FUNG|nr:hypothetical protein INT47_003561 [Mucor saturninus]